MNQIYELPEWLDSFIFEELNARYDRLMNSFNVSDMPMEALLGYLGTYFPRSYAESCGIFEDILKNNSFIDEKEEISIFDFGCGSGGDLFGLLNTINSFHKSVRTINIVVCDGNKNQLILLNRILSEAKNHFAFNINYDEIALTIKSSRDICGLFKFLEANYSGFDIAFSFKALCEFVNKGTLGKINPYTIFVNYFLNCISNDGVCLIEDMTYKVERTGEWLGDKMQEATIIYRNNIVSQNDNYNFQFYISHSRKKNDVSNAAWRSFAR